MLIVIRLHVYEIQCDLMLCGIDSHHECFWASARLDGVRYRFVPRRQRTADGQFSWWLRSRHEYRVYPMVLEVSVKTNSI